MIIDSHVHFADEAVPNRDLFRREMPCVLKPLAIPEGVTGVVVVEARQAWDENLWTLDLAAGEPFIFGYVGFLNLYSREFPVKLSQLASNRFFRGVRVHTLDHSSPQRERIFLENVEALAATDRTLDLHLGHYELGPAERIARNLPGLRMVINHIAQGLIFDSPPGPEWEANLRRIASFPQVAIKVSALVQMTYNEPTQESPEFYRKRAVPAPADPEYYRATIDTLWDIFGEDRLIYASNWPQIERVSDYAPALNIVRTYFEQKGEAADKFFWKNSAAFYKLAETGRVPRP